MPPARRPRSLLAFAAAALLLGCDDDPSTPVVNAPTGYEAIAIIHETADGEIIDLISRGATFVLDLNEVERTFRSRFQYLDTQVNLVGDYRFDGGDIVFSDDPFLEDDAVTETAMDFEQEGDRIFLRDLSTGIDLDGDGFRDVAELRLILVKD